MPHAHAVADDQHPDHVETVDLARTAVAIDPNARGSGQFALFSPVHRFDRIAKAGPALFGAPGFDLDKGH